MLTPKFTIQDIKNAIEERKEGLFSEILERLKYVGEEFVANARSTNTYKDKTTNLRSSIGYLIMQNGAVVFEAFPGSTAAGVEAGKAVALAATEKFAGHEGFVFICVAGMQYAGYVEAKGFDVITGSSQIAARSLETILKDITI